MTALLTDTWPLKKIWIHLTKLWKKQFHAKSSMNIHTHHPHCVHICPGCDENKSCIPLSCATLNCMLEQEARVLVVWDAEHTGWYFSQPNQGSYKHVSVIYFAPRIYSKLGNFQPPSEAVALWMIFYCVWLILLGLIQGNKTSWWLHC